MQFRPTVLAHCKWVDPIVADADGLSVSHAGAGAAGTRNMTLGGALAGVMDVARNVVIVVTHATAVVAMSGTITGTDEYGKTITEAWSVTATGTTKTFTGKKAFKTVTQITETVAADASANTIVAGSGVVLGLPFRAVSVVPVGEMVDGALATAGVIVAGAGSSATADWRGTYTPNSAPDGARDYEVFVLVDDPTDVG